MIATLCRHTPMKPIEIWSQKYSTGRVLLACYKVGEHNKVTFTKSKSMGTDPYYISGRTAKKYPKISNSTIMCYNVPLDELKLLEFNERCEHEM